MSDDNKIDQSMGPRVKAARKSFGLSQGDIAKDINKTQEYISRIENGVAPVTIDLLKILYFKYNISPTQIVTGTGPVILGFSQKKGTPDIEELKFEIEHLKAQVDLLFKKVYQKEL